VLIKDIEHIFHRTLDVQYGKEEVSSFFFLCISHYCNVSRLQLALDPNLSIVKEEQDAIFKTLESLKKEIPIQYILGETEFYGLPFKVNENTLIPRPETEELIELILDCHSEYSEESQFSILDVGTGSGCIAIALAKTMPNTIVYALDVSSKALTVARENAKLNGTVVRFVECDILKDWHSAFDTESKFDIIVSNPPYIRKLEKVDIKNNVLNNEPHLALFVDDDNPLIFYKAISEFAIEKLKPHGALFFEINEYLGNETKALVENLGFINVELIQDMFGKDRIVKGVKDI